MPAAPLPFRTTALPAALLTLSLAAAPPAGAQHGPGRQSSPNMHVLAHIPLGGAAPLMGEGFNGVPNLGRRTADIELEQDLARPYAYVAHRFPPSGFYIISIKDFAHPRVLYHWLVDNPELHEGSGALDNKYFKLRGRYYDIQSYQFRQNGPDGDLGAIVFDVNGLPDTTTIREVGRIREPETPGGFHNIFAYKHSDGRVLLFATVGAPEANVYDMERFLAHDPNQGRIAQIPIPEQLGRRARGYHDYYLAYDPATHQDKFYGAGGGGYYVYDITNLPETRLLVSATGIAGVGGGHTFTPDPTGRYAITETEYRYAPLRILDLKPGLDGQVKNISRPVGAWTAQWSNYSHNHEVRWPYVFVAAFDDGLQVFNMMDPTTPYTVGYYDTFDGPDGVPSIPETTYNGGWGVDVRNADGVIVLSDFTSGFWAIKMDGFDGWNGRQWGVPNASSVQDWDNGPDGAPKPAKVSLR